MIDRSLLEHHIVGVGNKDRLAIWLTMLSAAAWKDRVVFVNGKEIRLQKGQMVFSIRNLAEKSNTTRRVTERFITRLKLVSMIETDTVTGVSVITICNYDKYQSFNQYRGDSVGDGNGDAAVTGRGQGGDIKEHQTTPSTPSTLKKEPAGSSKKKRASRLDERWQLPDDWGEVATSMGLPQNRVQPEAEKMRDWSISSPNGAKLDWLATWRSWVRRIVEQNPQMAGAGAPSPDLVALKPDEPDFKAVEKMRGRPLVVGRSGTTTISKTEIERARRALA